MPFFRQFSLALLLAGVFLLASAGIVAASSPPQTTAQGEQIFQSKCAGCHSIGEGKRVGPDLKGVTGVRSAEWLAAFIAGPQQVIDSGDKDAGQLVKEYNGLVMPTLGLSQAEVAAVIDYLQAPGGTAAAANVALGDAARGQQLFSGGIALANGGTACNACHTVTGTGFLGGGSLGPNLSHAFTKYGGAAGMNTTLGSLPFPTMQGIFATRPLTAGEQADLLAFLQQADQQPAPAAPLNGLFFPAAGIAGAAALFGLLYRFWPRQRQSLSEKLRKGG